jgi:hypothetical protein
VPALSLEEHNQVALSTDLQLRINGLKMIAHCCRRHLQLARNLLVWQTTPELIDYRALSLGQRVDQRRLARGEEPQVIERAS